MPVYGTWQGKPAAMRWFSMLDLVDEVAWNVDAGAWFWV